MNPALGHRRGPRLGQRPPPVRRWVLGLAAAVGLAIAAPVEAQSAAGTSYGPVQRADTLWDLAVRFRGDAGVNMRQAIIAILRANPEAFVDGNINALRTGVTLQVPSAAEMASITPGEASAEYARHQEAWRNRRRTGSAAPVPDPQAGSPSAAPGAVVADESRESATVVELRQRLAERDAAIEDLLVQLAAAQRELQDARGDAPESAAGQEEAAAPPAAGGRESPLPVSPLILGSSLIVLLVLIVVVTLLRQRGEAEEPHAEEPWEEDGEDLGDGEDGGASRAGEEDREARHASAGETSGEEARGARAAGLAAPGALAAEHGFGQDDEAGEPREDETDNLPIGMDLEGEEDDWGVPPGESMQGGPEQGDPGDPPGFGRHVDVGELDELDLDLDGDPAPGSFPEIPADPRERDDPLEGIGPAGPPTPGRRE